MQIYFFHTLIKHIIHIISKVVVPRAELCPQIAIYYRKRNFIPNKMQLFTKNDVSLHNI